MRIDPFETGCTEESNAFDDGEVCADNPEEIGAPCLICERKAAEAMAEAKREYDATSPMDRLYDRLDGDLARKKAYAEEMRDCGREHLLTEDEKNV